MPKVNFAFRTDPSPDPIEWAPNSLGAVYPRVEEQFCGAAEVKRQKQSERVRKYKDREMRFKQGAAQ